MTNHDTSPRENDARAISIARCFLPASAALRVAPLGQGLINDTYLIDGGPERYVLQRVNGAVFADADAIATNLLRVQGWLEAQQHTDLRFPRLLHAPSGEATVRDDEGQAWRLMEYIENSRVLKPLANLRQAREVGRTLGRFHAALAGLDPTQLALTLPDLHDTPRCKAKLEAAIGEPQRPICSEVTAAVAQIEARAERLSVLQQARANGTLATQVTHGDPKLDNVLFERSSDRAVCLIDLDTVQPGLLHHDLADCLRSCCNRAGELLASPAAHFDLNIADALLGGYSEAAAHLLDDEAIGFLFVAIEVIPLELAMRFLTDHLEGDRYFRVSHPRQNLVKAQIQLALMTDIEAKRDAVERIIDACFSTGRSAASRPHPVSSDAPEGDALQLQAQSLLIQLAELLAELDHARAGEIESLASRFADDPAAVWRAIDGNDWWAGAGSLAAETMIDNPGIDPHQWDMMVRRFRELLIEIGEILQARGPSNPGLGSWLLAFRNWNASGV